MILQAIQTFTEYNKTGIDDMLVYGAKTNPIFVPFILLTLFFIVTWATYFGARRYNGKEDFFASLATGSYITFMATVFMSLADGLVSLEIKAIVFAVAVACTIALFVTDR